MVFCKWCPFSSPPQDVSVVEETVVPPRRSGHRTNVTDIENENKDVKIEKCTKTEKEEELIKTAVCKNDFLYNLLQGDRLQSVVDAMYSREVTPDEIIIQEGSVGTQLYISASGTYEITINGNFIIAFSDNRVFGELAVLYNAKRQATIRALKEGRLWVLDQSVYRQISVKSEIEHHDERLDFLRDVPTINSVSNQQLGRVADLLESEFFSADSVIIRQGDLGDKFYIIGAGSVTITKEGEDEITRLNRGQFFGELALLTEDNRRQATVTAGPLGVECLTLSKPQFQEHFGNIDDFLTVTQRKTSKPIVQLYQDIKYSDLKIIGTLGAGGFGRVELVQHKSQKNLTFALKYLNKIDMVKQHQEVHVFSEKNIQINCDSIFIVHLYKTFRNNKRLYFLMESCLGGDLFTLLHKQKTLGFDENTAQFYAGCVLEALAYLHERDVVYRDLKPENLLLDSRGYLKLTDFGFAKKLDDRNKSYTFAGTPEYVAPEIILNRGHDRAIDYWALGIFIFELLVGKTPFHNKDATHMTTYSLILRGIENVRFPERVPARARNLVKKLCQAIPTSRLGCQKDGPQAIRNHKWFSEFNWKSLCSGEMKAPIKRQLKNNIDLKYFERFEPDEYEPPDEISGWDKDF